MVGEGEKLSIYDDDDVSPYLEGLDQEERRGGTGASREAPPSTREDDSSSSAPVPPPAPGDQVSDLSFRFNILLLKEVTVIFLNKKLH